MDVNFDDIDLYSISTRSQEYYNWELNNNKAPAFWLAKAHIWDNQTVKITGGPQDASGYGWASYPVDYNWPENPDTTQYQKAVRMGQGNPDEGGFSRVGILGDDLNLTISNNGQDYAISGTVEAFVDIGFDAINNPYGYIPNYSVVGMNISANKLVDAINSSSKSDDKELLEEVFSGDDTFVSKYSFASKNYYSPTGDDILYGYAGDDTFQPDKGDDFIDGGDGFDTVIIGGLKSSYTLSYDTATETAVLNSSYYGKNL